MVKTDLFAPVPERDFLRGYQAVIDDYDARGGERSMERSMGVLCQLFPRTSGTPARIMLRMRALLGVWDHPLMKGWKQDIGTEGEALIEDSVLKVAARHPLAPTERLEFDPETFFREVLRRCERNGTA